MLVKLLANFSPEVDVSHALLHQKVDGIDCFLDVVWLGTEQVADSWDTIALLRLLDVLEIIHQISFLNFTLITDLTQSWWVHDIILRIVVAKVEAEVIEIVVEHISSLDSNSNLINIKRR